MLTTRAPVRDAGAPDSSSPEGAAGSRAVLDEYRTGGPRGERFELSIAACADGECPLQVGLRDDSTERGAVSLDWASPDREAARSSATNVWGTGDPRDTTRVQSWSTGEEASSVETAARIVTLAAGVPGLLVWQQGGFEHVRRMHYVITAAEGGPRIAWKGEELGGPFTGSSVTVIRDSAGVDAPVFHSSAFYLDDAADEPDHVRVAPLAWDGRGLAEVRAPMGRLFGVATKSFEGPTGARAARNAHEACVADFDVVPSPDGQPGLVLLVVSASRAVAEARREQAARCAGALTPKVVALPAPFSSSRDDG